MADERVITLRFKAESFVDMELYRSLEKEKQELGLSMPVYVKDILRQHFENTQREQMDAEMSSYLKQVQDTVHEELSSFQELFEGILVEMSGGSFDNIKKEIYDGVFAKKKEVLPGYSEELPDGMDSILEQFM